MCCPSCDLHRRALSIPRQVREASPVIAPSPEFYRNLRKGLAHDSRAGGGAQILMSLPRQLVPALAVITLMLLSAFAYLEYRRSEVNIYQAYEAILIADDPADEMVIADRDEWTDGALLRALAGSETRLPGKD
jgi:hypothetical protein